MSSRNRRLAAGTVRARHTLLGLASAAALLLVLCSALAWGGVIERKGNLQVSVSGKLAPSSLPRDGAAPVAVSVGGKISTTDGTEPPQLRKLTIEINRHGHIDSTGLQTCKASAIRTASNGRALGACGPALVGKGKFLGTITLPGAEPYPLEGKLLVFNSLEGHKHVLLGHVFSPHPFATSFVIPFEIRSAAKGPYGTVLVANMTKALGTQKTLTGIEMTLSRRYAYRGRQLSYVSAGCPAPKGVNVASFPLARTSFFFADGAKFDPVLTRSCKAQG